MFHPFGGAVDIIVVKQEDGTYKTAPWYVRFGKFQGVLKRREKIVTITVNDVEAGFHMYLDTKGEAYFAQEEEEEVVGALEYRKEPQKLLEAGKLTDIKYLEYKVETDDPIGETKTEPIDEAITDSNSDVSARIEDPITDCGPSVPSILKSTSLPLPQVSNNGEEIDSHGPSVNVSHSLPHMSREGKGGEGGSSNALLPLELNSDGLDSDGPSLLQARENSERKEKHDMDSGVFLTSPIHSPSSFNSFAINEIDPNVIQRLSASNEIDPKIILPAENEINPNSKSIHSLVLSGRNSGLVTSQLAVAIDSTAVLLAESSAAALAAETVKNMRKEILKSPIEIVEGVSDNNQLENTSLETSQVHAEEASFSFSHSGNLSLGGNVLGVVSVNRDNGGELSAGNQNYKQNQASNVTNSRSAASILALNSFSGSHSSLESVSVTSSPSIPFERSQSTPQSELEAGNSVLPPQRNYLSDSEKKTQFLLPAPGRSDSVMPNGSLQTESETESEQGNDPKLKAAMEREMAWREVIEKAATAVKNAPSSSRQAFEDALKRDENKEQRQKRGWGWFGWRARPPKADQNVVKGKSSSPTQSLQGEKQIAEQIEEKAGTGEESDSQSRVSEEILTGTLVETFDLKLESEEQDRGGGTAVSGDARSQQEQFLDGGGNKGKSHGEHLLAERAQNVVDMIDSQWSSPRAEKHSPKRILGGTNVENVATVFEDNQKNSEGVLMDEKLEDDGLREGTKEKHIGVVEEQQIPCKEEGPMKEDEPIKICIDGLGLPEVKVENGDSVSNEKEKSITEEGFGKDMTLQNFTTEKLEGLKEDESLDLGIDNDLLRKGKEEEDVIQLSIEKKEISDEGLTDNKRVETVIDNDIFLEEYTENGIDPSVENQETFAKAFLEENEPTRICIDDCGFMEVKEGSEISVSNEIEQNGVEEKGLPEDISLGTTGESGCLGEEKERKEKSLSEKQQTGVGEKGFEEGKPLEKCNDNGWLKENKEEKDIHVLGEKQEMVEKEGPMENKPSAMSIGNINVLEESTNSQEQEAELERLVTSGISLNTEHGDTITLEDDQTNMVAIQDEVVLMSSDGHVMVATVAEEDIVDGCETKVDAVESSKSEHNEVIAEEDEVVLMSSDGHMMVATVAEEDVGDCVEKKLVKGVLELDTVATISTEENKGDEKTDITNMAVEDDVFRSCHSSLIGISDLFPGVDEGSSVLLRDEQGLSVIEETVKNFESSPRSSLDEADASEAETIADEIAGEAKPSDQSAAGFQVDNISAVPDVTDQDVKQNHDCGEEIQPSDPLGNNVPVTLHGETSEEKVSDISNQKTTKLPEPQLSPPSPSTGLELSLCRHLLNDRMGIDAAATAFESQRVTMDQFMRKSSNVTNNDRLVVRVDGRYYPWSVAAPRLLGMLAFGQVMPPIGAELDGAIRIEKPQRPSPKPSKSDSEKSPGQEIVLAGSGNRGGWTIWPFGGNRREQQGSNGGNSGNKTSGPSIPPEVMLAAAGAALDNPLTKELLYGVNGFYARPRKQRVRMHSPTSEQLATLPLQEGKNRITFSFTTRVLGKQQVECALFVWKYNTRVVVSDVDGTITKSDVLGQVMPLMGRDWTQLGVARLFSAIRENGYELMFLSARAITQAYLTRTFLFTLKQDGSCLPEGPVVISPDGLFPSLYREVIRRAPHEFKIACLSDIRALFPSDRNPFYAGFGNRETDAISYEAVGIPKGKVFIINPKGEVVVNNMTDVRSYGSLHSLVHDIFPAIKIADENPEREDFNNWNFWKMPLPDIDDLTPVESMQIVSRKKRSSFRSAGRTS